MKLTELFEQDRKKVVDDLKSKKKEKHTKESKMKQPPQSAGYNIYTDQSVDNLDGMF